MRRWTQLVLLICSGGAGCMAAPSADSTQQQPDLIHHLAQTNAKVEQFEFSPSGDRIAYVSAKNGSYDIWVMNADGSGAKAVTSQYPEAELHPSWSPDGQWIAYASRGEIFMVRADGSGPPINLTYAGGGNSVPEWSPDGAWIAYVTGDLTSFPSLDIDIIPAAIPAGGTRHRYLTRTDTRDESNPIWSPDGSRLAFTSGGSVWLVPAAGGVPKEVASGGSPQWSPDGRRIAFVSSQTGFAKIYVTDLGTGATKAVTTGEQEDGNPQWSPGGDEIAFVRVFDWNFHIMKVDADGGTPQQLTTGEGVNGGWEGGQVRGTLRWHPDGSGIAYTAMSAGRPNDIWTLPADGGEPRQLTDHLPAELRSMDFVSPELIRYKSHDGLEVPAFLYRPRLGASAASGSAPYPLIVYARANTTGMHVNGFYPYIQAYLARGYAVVAPNVRGSGGAGVEYLQLNAGDWGGKDVDDLAAAVDHLVAQGIADPERVGIQGGSTGGFFTSLSLVRYPAKYKAGVNFYGPVDMVRFQQYRENSYRRDVLRRVMGPDYNAPLFHERSAINFVDRIQAPLLILWGDRDYSVRPSQAEAMVDAMTKAGKSVEYHIYAGEDHGWYTWRPENVEHSLRLILEFYDRHLGGGS